MSLKTSLIYKLLKNVYYKFIFYRKYSFKYFEKRAVAKFHGVDLYFCLDNNNKENKSCKDLFFINELESYFQKRDILENDIVLDCGAYHGNFTIYASKKIGPLGKVIAFEPDPKNLKILKKNIRLNSCKNVIIVEQGIFNKNTLLKFKQNGEAGKVSKSGNITIKVTSLDKAIKKLNLGPTKINFIKMDIEGAEIEAIDGAKKILTKGNPYLAIASYHIVNNEPTTRIVEKKLAKLNYYTQTGNSHTTTIGIKKS